MRRFRVRFLDEARAQLEHIDRWWNRHRREHPELVDEEMSEAIRVLAASPEAGTEVKRPRGFRRMLLGRSQYWVYYRVDEDAHEVMIAAIWKTSRGQGPRLR